MTKSNWSPIAKLDCLSVGYDGRALVDGISLELASGTIACLIGRNGSGKSTVLRTIAGQVKPIAGSLVLDGETVTENALWKRVRAHRIGYLVQGQRHFPSLSVREHLHLALWHSPAAWRGREAAIERLLASAPFSALITSIERGASTLSGGQDMLLGLAKCVLQNCRLLLLDEPSTGLSVGHRLEVFSYLRALANERAILMVEQSMSVAFGYCDVVYQIRKKPGNEADLPAMCVQVDRAEHALIAEKYRAGRAEEASKAVAALLGVA